MKCSGEESLVADRVILPLAASVSIVSYFLIFYLYYYKKVPTLKRHPTGLAFLCCPSQFLHSAAALGVKKCIFELIFVSQYLWIPLAPIDFFWKSEDDCVASNWAGFFSFVTQFSLLGGELWFFVLTLDLHFACTNPFTSYKLNAQRYEIFVICGSLMTASALLISGPDVYGLSSDLTCWIQVLPFKFRTSLSLPSQPLFLSLSQDTSQESGKTLRYNPAKTILFYLPMAAIYSYCLYVVLFVFQRLKQGLSETLHTRLSTVRRAQAYVLGYFLFWMFPLVFSFVDFVFENSSHGTLRTLTAFFLAIRGLFSALILLSPNWNEMKSFLEATSSKSGSMTDGLVQNVVEEDLSLRPHLNTALRAEIIFFTTQGIRFASREATKNLQPKNERGKPLHKDHRPTSRPAPPEVPVDVSSATSMSNVDSSHVRTFLCNDMSRTQSEDVTGSPFHHNPETFDDLSRLEAAQRESISEGTIEADLEDALDSLGIFDDKKTSSQRYYRTSGPPLHPLSSQQQQQQQQRERGFIDNPLAPTASNANLRTSLLVGAHSSNSRDIESAKEEHVNGITSSSIGGASSAPSSSHHLSVEGSEYGRQSETEFRLFLDGDPQSIEKRRSHPKTTSRNLSHRSHGSPTGSGTGSDTGGLGNGNDTVQDNESVRDRIKRNLSLAFGTKERLRNLLTTTHSSSHSSPHNQSSSSNSLIHRNDFIFKDFLPHVFAEVRETCCIDPLEYFEAFQKTTKEKFSEGRSGAFLYFSSNQKFIVKTTTKNEINSLLKIMKEYLSYLIANPNSLLVRFLGAHSLTMYGRVLYFVVMLNVFSKAELSERYDLKGSWVQRHGDNFFERRKLKSNKSSASTKQTSAPLYKDNDLQHKITLNPEVANALHDQIFRDTAFLTGLGLMDYSLLVGVVRRKFEVMDRNTSIHTFPPEAATGGPISSSSSSAVDVFQRDADGGMHAAVVEGPGTYYMGIIDVLQEWNWEKKLERFFKIYFKWMDADGLSAAPPQVYVERFMKRCVVEVFDGLYVSDSDFNPKMRNMHGTYRQPSRGIFLDDNFSEVEGEGGGGGGRGRGGEGNDGDEEGGGEGRDDSATGTSALSVSAFAAAAFDSSLQLSASADRFRSTTGIDRRFSAAPLDNGSHSLQMISARGGLGASSRGLTLEDGLQTELE